MNIEELLSHLDHQEENLKEKQKLALETQKTKEHAEQAFVSEFDNFCSKILQGILSSFGERLSTRFEFTYQSTLQFHPNYCLNSIYLSPKFESTIKALTIDFIAEPSRRLISISAKPLDIRNNSKNNSFAPFQDTFEKFTKLDFENVVTSIIARVFSVE